MVAFNTSFQALAVAVVLGLSANAVPSPGRGKSPSGSTKSDSSSSSSSSGYSVMTANGKCIANSASPDRFKDKKFLKLFPDFAKSKSRRAGSDDEDEPVVVKFDVKNRPNPKTKITLFHGTIPKYAGSLYSGIRIFNNPGDMSANGGFYLTNSLRAAGQWGCHGRGTAVEQTTVFEYVWDGTQKDLKIRSYEDWENQEEYMAFCTYNLCTSPKLSKGLLASAKKVSELDHDMIAGPMMPVGGAITPTFYEYALLKEAKAKSPYLTRTGYHLLDCDKFKQGDIDTHDTQGPVAKFSKEEMKSVGLTGKNSFTAAPPADWATGDGKIDLAARPKDT